MDVLYVSVQISLLALYALAAINGYKICDGVEAPCPEDLLWTMENLILFGTNWNLFWQVTFLLYSVCVEFAADFSNRGLLDRLEAIRSAIFLIFVLPGTMNVMVFFWSVYHYDRSTIYPKEWEGFFAPWMNHCSHTAIIVTVVLELSRKRISWGGRSRLFFYVSSLCIGLSYIVVLFGVYFFYGTWIYKIYYVVTWRSKIMIIFSIPVIAFCSQKFAFALDSWKEDRRRSKSE